MMKLAVFDIDGTLTKAHLGVEFLKEMALLGAIQGVSPELFMRQYDEWGRAEDRTQYYDDNFDDYYTSRLVGVEQAVFEKAGEKVALHAFPSFYKPILEQLRERQSEGRYVLLISKSPVQAVSHIAKLVGASDYWGWEFNFDAHQKYIDQFIYPNGESDKAHIVNEKVREKNLTLEDSYAYGDSNGDMTLLKIVTHPVAVNPEPKLLKEALENDWQVISTAEYT